KKRWRGIEFTGVSDDSRKVKKGDIFFAVSGSRFDGGKFIDEAIEKGAAAVVMSKKDGSMVKGAKIIEVDNTRAALAECASLFYENPSKKIKVIGITGTNGKTTISYLLRDIFKKAGHEAGVIGTIAHMWKNKVIEARNTTPGSLELQGLLRDMALDGVRYCAMEVSSHSLDQERVLGIDFNSAIFTNITGEHLDYHRTFENYLKAKIRLFSSLESGRLAVLNWDDENSKRIRQETRGARVITYGMEKDADVKADEITFSLEGTEFLVKTKEWGSFKLKSPLIGRFNVSNILAAVSAALNEGIGKETIIEAVAAFRGAAGRLESVETGRGVKIFIDYAHTDDALENVLKALRPLINNRLIVVFGCGGDRDRLKRPRMGKVASRHADYVIITSDNPRGEDPLGIAREIEKGLTEGFKSYELILDMRQAIKNALDIAKTGDIILLAGKGHEKYQIVKDNVLEFNDREEVLKFDNHVYHR
ncbi:MAG: UDP-N-acetylmuramoyl-L-alanyl-D-glutamate--2,6-diaminopimelate ligase, partial [Candidatus Omnitrophica bacterium]|nr:UDP-N-acetylmuramoyl-L-alanyl-D-glutamate--2,6-diaminopimelate ligase [Candidatus Omnitrophota bacterium]